MTSETAPTFFIGDRFKNYKEFDEKLKARIQVTNEKLAKTNDCKSVQTYNSRNQGKKYREDIKYKILRLQCTHGGIFKKQSRQRKKSLLVTFLFFVFNS